MPILLALVLGAQAASAPIWQLTDAIAISGVSHGGRVPFPQDDLLPILAARGDQALFRAGDTVTGRNGTEHKWVDTHANAKGALNQPQAGYVQATIHSGGERPAVLTVSGDGMLYWNGAPRPGDVYGYGYLSLPVLMRAGENTLLIASGRGDVTARLDAPKAPQQFNLSDPTLPDVLTTDKGTLLGSVVVLNSSDVPARYLKIRATIGDKTVETTEPDIAPFSLRKVPFRFPVVADAAGTNQTIRLVLVGGQGDEDTGELKVSVVDPLTTHKRTFVSSIDGSVQYYAVVPAKKPSKSNALVLTLHGASVEAIGQARAYQAKDWCTIVAATNRRPYGFDWEDVGRLDALEVLDIAERTYPHDPARVVLTGHSMGGHGTWSIGTLYPNLFAAIAPSAGWVSFQSYAGGFQPQHPDKVEDLFLAAGETGDTLGRVRNTLEYKTYILHGDADDNVPVTEARTMRKALTDIGADFVYHEQPGAGHWWGNQCVDWPPLFDLLREARLRPADDPAPIDFTTPDPQVSSTLRWVTIRQQLHGGLSSVRADIKDGTIDVRTTNVAELELRQPRAKIGRIEIDGYDIANPKLPLRLERAQAPGSAASGGVFGWMPAHEPSTDKGPARYGGFKQVFQHDMVLVVGTHGDDANRLWGFARYLAESLYYRGNGAVDIMSDADYLKHRGERSFRNRNVLLFGNADDNAAWAALLTNCPVKVNQGSIADPAGRFGGDAALITYPLPGSDTALVGAFGIADARAIDVLERVPVLPSGTAYPDWCVLDTANEATEGTRGIAAAGNFGPAWQFDPSQTVTP